MSVNETIVTDLINNGIEFVTTVPCKQLAGVIEKIDSLGDSVASTRTWTLTIQVTFAAMVFGTMARGFGWI